MTISSPQPSGPPVAYSICVGWKTRELDLGKKGEGRPRTGGDVRPVPTAMVERGDDLFRDCTTIRCDFQCTGVIEEFLKRRFA